MRRPVWLIATLVTACISSATMARGVTEASLRAHISVLASDEFEGRAPGTEGETKTLNYIVDQWNKAGLKAGAKEGSWLEPVHLIQRGPGEIKYALTAGSRQLRLPSSEFLLIGKDAFYQNKKLDLFFGGYGVKPDGSAIDGVVGKAVVILFDQPENVPEKMHSARARREALIAAGAEAVIVVADSQGNWSAIRRQMLSRPIALESREIRAPLEGAISSEFAVAMVTAAGKDWDKLRQHARLADFKGETLGINADLDVNTDVHRFDSQNVIGKIPGRKPGSGAVVYMGHWDHLGICRPDAEDKICNGAVDNASGVAVLTEVARALAKKRGDRDIYFVATTAEESGLLGAYAFTENPPVPLSDIVVAMNIDTIAVARRGSKVAIMGRGNTRIDSVVDNAARRAGRQVELSMDADALIQRQDGWALKSKGVPTILVGGSFADMDLMQKFLGSEYHGPDDELNDKIELGGAAEDADLHIELGKYFSNVKKYKPVKAGG